MRRRSPKASLSPAEVSSLRRVASGLAKFLSSDARELLMSMGLISLTLGGRLVLTEEGKQRLAAEGADAKPVRASTQRLRLATPSEGTKAALAAAQG